MVQGWLEIIATNIGAFDRTIDEGTEFTQALSVVEHLPLLFQLLYFTRDEFRLLDLLDFEAQKFGTADLLAFVLLKCVQVFAYSAPIGDFCGELFAQGQQFCIAVKEIDMLLRPQQAHVLALTVNIDQPAGYVLKCLLGDEPTIDACDSAASAGDIATENEFAIVWCDTVFVEQSSKSNTGVGTASISLAVGALLLGIVECLEHTAGSIAGCTLRCVQ